MEPIVFDINDAASETTHDDASSETSFDLRSEASCEAESIVRQAEGAEELPG